MPAAERRKGKKAELDVVHYLVSKGWDAITSRSSTGRQKGYDILVNAPFAIEVKDHGRTDLPGWLRQARDSAGDLIPVVWHKKRGTSNPAEWYVTMEGNTFLEVMEAFREH